jgi:hypothetical protein
MSFSPISSHQHAAICADDKPDTSALLTIFGKLKVILPRIWNERNFNTVK